jgi:MazG family protein
VTSPPSPGSPQLPSSERRSFDRALDLVRFLRVNCPWDARQTPDSLVPYLLEEAHEVAEAIALRHEPELARELGDLLLNVAFQAVLAEERGSFTAEDVVEHLEEKMRRRHPQLYGLGPAEDWERLKVKERAGETGETSVLDGIPKGLDPLSRAQRIQDRVAAVGFDWPNAEGALAKVHEELEELRIEQGNAPSQGPAHPPVPGADLVEEVGDLLFSVVNVARLLGAHAMTALSLANEKFARRFRTLEALARSRGIDVEAASLEELDALWNEVKKKERAEG